MKRVLVTGFEPFGGHTTNASQVLVEALVGTPPAGIAVTSAVLPVSYARAAAELTRAVRAAEPEVVVCFGQAGGRPGVAIERIAINLDDAVTADNDGVVSAAEIDLQGPAAYRSTLPVDGIVDALRREEIPAGASHDAGGFVCNHVFYTLMRVLEREHPHTRGGLVHVPLLPSQALTGPAPTISLAMLERAGRIVLEVASA